MKKAHIKALKKLSEQLPLSKELQQYSMAVQGFEIDPAEYDPAVHNVQPEEWYIQKGHYRLVEINHLNRLKKAYAKNKEQGIIEYIQWVDKNNEQLNQIFERKEMQRVERELMDLAAKGAGNFWSNLIKFLYAFIKTFIQPKTAAA
jgi:hypothetical protein